MDTIKTRKKYQSVVMFISSMILLLPVTGMTAQIKSMEVIKAGPRAIQKDAGKEMANELTSHNIFLHQNPYYIGRPVMVRVVYSCDKTPQKLSTIVIETEQQQNKWGEWETDTGQLKRIIQGKCGEKTESERQQEKLSEKEDKIEKLQNTTKKSYERGDFKTAIEGDNKLIVLNPKDAGAYNNRGAAYSALGKYNEAIVDLNKAIELDPKYANSYYNRARSYSKTGDVKSALQDLYKAIQLKPTYKDKANTEKDFENIRNNPDFKKLIGE